MRTISLKKSFAFCLALVMICLVFGAVALYGGQSEAKNEVFAASTGHILKLQIGNPNMTIDDEEKEIDPGMGTVPVVINDRTLLPVRAIVEAVGGKVEWEQNTQTVSLEYKSDTIKLVINSDTAYLNDEQVQIDVSPVIINDRTMLPIRFIAEGFGFDVAWDDDTQTVTINVPAALQPEPTFYATDSADAPIVYMTTDISPEALTKIYNELGFKAEGNVAVKMSTGEPPNSNYLRPELIKDLVQSVDGTIVECNTAYGGSRANTEMHKQVIKDHGFYDIADVDIMDEEDSMTIPISKGNNIKVDYVGTHLANYDSLISLAHFKGHAMGGFGGAIKNMSIGVASQKGKCNIHTAGASLESPWGGDQDKFLESMAEATSGVVDYFDGKVVYINVMNNLSVDCDCDGNPAAPEMQDIGILASTDPVALDQACIDLVYAQRENGAAALIERIESRHGLHTLEHAAQIGLGSRSYNLKNIDI